jgi:thiol-disulfide isomerase/thioredoxin
MDQTHRSHVVLTLLILGSACATTSAEAPGATVGAVLPELKVSSLDDRAFHREALAGKVVLLDLWASWCAPCKEELPLLDEMATRLRSKGVTILAVSIDENREDAVGFVKSRAKPWSLSLVHDPEGKLAEKMKPARMPTSYIIDRAGVIRQVNAGFEREDVSRIEARLTQLAAKP